MNLHHKTDEFITLINLTSKYYSLPISAIRKDYYITMILNNLANSSYRDIVVFKGGTSLSKCYPNSIKRFSEDIDLTYIPNEDMSNKQISKILKNIEIELANNFKLEKINRERNDRNKSSYIWYNDEYKNDEIIKLEIGSSVKPHPYSKKSLKSYIQSYLETFNYMNEISDFELNSVTVCVLDIERTFIDKIMSVKRHALCSTLTNKVRHIYDVTQLFGIPEIRNLLNDKDKLKELIRITKDTDSHYLEKRNIPNTYNPTEKYSFENWKNFFNDDIRVKYENLHKTLLYTDEKQDFELAIKTFSTIDKILKDIGE